MRAPVVFEPDALSFTTTTSLLRGAGLLPPPFEQPLATVATAIRNIVILMIILRWVS